MGLTPIGILIGYFNANSEQGIDHQQEISIILSLIINNAAANLPKTCTIKP